MAAFKAAAVGVGSEGVPADVAATVGEAASGDDKSHNASSQIASSSSLPAPSSSAADSTSAVLVVVAATAAATAAAVAADEALWRLTRLALSEKDAASLETNSDSDSASLIIGENLDAEFLLDGAKEGLMEGAGERCEAAEVRCDAAGLRLEGDEYVPRWAEPVGRAFDWSISFRTTETLRNNMEDRQHAHDLAGSILFCFVFC